MGLAVLAASPTFPQAATDEVSEQATSAASSATVAYVYVQTSSGVNLYDATAAGKLTIVKGSPFQPSGPGQTLVGTNGKYLIMLGANDLHSYPVVSTGAIEKQVFQVDTQSYGGSDCGAPTRSSEFDHSGENVYVLLSYADTDCNAIQTYAISESGQFEFKGDTTVSTGSNFAIGLPTMTGNGKLGYGELFDGYDNSCGPGLLAYRSESEDVLQYDNINPIGSLPPTPPGKGYAGWITSAPPALASDATDHIVLAMYPTTDEDCEDSNIVTGSTQLASFTANSSGTLTTINTYENMPVLDGGPNMIIPNTMSISPSGKVLAAAVGTGIQFFHFNGAKPITKFTGIIGLSGSITTMQWDKSNHLYAINGATGNVHIYTVTTTSVVEVPGSPYSVGATGLVVAVP
ncbi:MAG: hypothetical protein ABSF53_25265, partial [Terracidiphilus sp.]